MHGDKHCRYVLLEFSDLLTSDTQLYFFETLHGNFEQGIFRPLAEPVDGGAVYVCREHAQAVPEGFSDRAHAEDDVEVVSNSLDEVGKHGVWCVLDAVLLGIGSEGLSYL